jgi:hypothetical protein
MRTTDRARLWRRLGAVAVSVTVSGCILNPQTDDPNAQGSSAENGGGGGTTMGAGGSKNMGGGGFPVFNPPPGGGAAGTNYGGGTDAGVRGTGGYAPTTPIDAAASDAGSTDGGPADAGDARADRHVDPTRD